MGLTINTNIASLNAQRNLNKSKSPLETAMQRLSSGLKINSAKDDAAGLAMATRMQRQSRGLSVAIKMPMMVSPLPKLPRVRWMR